MVKMLAAALAAAIAAAVLLIVPGESDGPRLDPVVAESYAPPPSNAGFDYQIGGDYPLPEGVSVVSRDWFAGEAADRPRLFDLLRQRVPDPGERIRHRPSRRALQLAAEADPRQAR